MRLKMTKWFYIMFMTLLIFFTFNTKPSYAADYWVWDPSHSHKDYTNAFCSDFFCNAFGGEGGENNSIYNAYGYLPKLEGIYYALTTNRNDWLKQEAVYTTGITKWVKKEEKDIWKDNPLWAQRDFGEDYNSYNSDRHRYFFKVGKTSSQRTIPSDTEENKNANTDISYLRVLNVNLQEVDGEKTNYQQDVHGNSFPLTETFKNEKGETRYVFYKQSIKMEEMVTDPNEKGWYHVEGTNWDKTTGVTEEQANTLNKEALKFAVYATKATDKENKDTKNKDTTEKTTYITDITDKQQEMSLEEYAMRDYIRENQVNYSNKEYNGDVDASGVWQYVRGYEVEETPKDVNITEYKETINNIVTGLTQVKLTAKELKDYATHAKPTIQYENGNTVIGPYSITQKYGKITRIEIETENGTISTENSEIEYYIDNGEAKKPGLTSDEKDAVVDIESIDIKGEDNFYIIVKNKKINNVKQIKLIKNYTNYQARIVMAFGAWRYNPVNAMYYGQRFIEESVCILPTIPNSSITILKKDANTGEELKKVEFVIQHKETGKYLIQGNPEGTFSINSATKIKSSQKLDGIKQAGTYIIWEVKNENDNYPEATLQKPINVGEVSIGLGEDKSITITNQKQYIKISGYVWQDIEPNGGTRKDRNALYRNGSNDTKDQLLSGIRVQLKDKTTGVIQETTTGSDGKYLFEKVEINKLSNYYIVFQYNGMNYQSVLKTLTATNGSKAVESNRQEFNQKFETITYGSANRVKNGTLEKTYNLKYKESDGKSELFYRDDEDESKYKNGYDGGGPVSGVDSMYIIEANTYQAYGGYLDKIMSADEIRESEITEIQNINLGIGKREQPDLSLSKSLNTVTVAIKGQMQKYQYATDTAQTPVQKIYQNGNTYVRALYESDIYYGDNDEEVKDKLEIKVTYAIKISNTSSNLRAKVNSIEDFYDKLYLSEREKENIIVGKSIDEEGNITDSIKTTQIAESSSYYKVAIPTDLMIGAGEEEIIYVQLTVDRDKIVDIFEDGKEPTLNNIAEIASYSIYDENGDVYGGIDKDSQPGNFCINDKETYEDDTGKAQELQLVLQEPRKVEGIVFEDSVTSEVGIGETRKGDGRYTEGENKIGNVTVELVDSNGKTVQVYNAESGRWGDATVQTNDNGDYKIEGFLPGDYQIKYTWGDKTYTVQNYKSTTVDYNTYKQKLKNKQWYKNNFKSEELKDVEWNTQTNTEIRVSDAVDNYETRQKIDAQTNIVTNESQKIINSKDENTMIKVEMEDGGIDEQKLITKMDSTTPTFEVNIEYIEYNAEKITNSYEEYELDDKGNINKKDNKYVEKTQSHKNHIENIDFGIVERARQKLGLYKYVSNAKITLANGTVLPNVNVKINENGEFELQSELKSVSYLPRTNKNNGKILFEIDNEIVQGATLQIIYGFYIKNESELDYNDMDYYYYGKEPKSNKQVKLKVEKIIDYLEDELNIYPEDMEEQWDILTTDGEKKALITEGLLENDNETFIKGANRILVTKDDVFANETFLEPGQTSNSATEMTLVSSKLLSISNDECTFDNYAEIIKVKKTGGASLYSSTLGNYIPSDSTTKEIDSDQAETVSVIPTTGGNRNYVLTIAIGVTVFAILGIGIVVIKKKVI